MTRSYHLKGHTLEAKRRSWYHKEEKWRVVLDGKIVARVHDRDFAAAIARVATMARQIPPGSDSRAA